MFNLIGRGSVVLDMLHVSSNRGSADMTGKVGWGLAVAILVSIVDRPKVMIPAVMVLLSGRVIVPRMTGMRREW